MKRSILLVLFLIAAAALFSPTCWADGTDPGAGTKGCGGNTGVACDLSPIGTTITFTAFAAGGNVGDTATASVFDPLTTPVSEFLVTFQPTVTVNGVTEALSYSCDSSEVEGAMNCTPEGGTTFLFSFAPSSGETLCPAPPLSETTTASTVSSTCFVGETIILTILGTDPTNLGGVALTASTSLPEPASGLLLLFGLAAGGLAGLRKRIPFLA